MNDIVKKSMVFFAAIAAVLIAITFLINSSYQRKFQEQKQESDAKIKMLLDSISGFQDTLRIALANNRSQLEVIPYLREVKRVAAQLPSLGFEVADNSELEIRLNVLTQELADHAPANSAFGDTVTTLANGVFDYLLLFTRGIAHDRFYEEGSRDFTRELQVLQRSNSQKSTNELLDAKRTISNLEKENNWLKDQLRSDSTSNNCSHKACEENLMDQVEASNAVLSRVISFVDHGQLRRKDKLIKIRNLANDIVNPNP